MIYFSLDDNATELLPRLVAIDQKIPINVVKAPKKYESKPTLLSKRKIGLDNLKRTLNHLKIMDSNKGTSVEYIETQLKRHQTQIKMKDERYKVVALIDNFHDITVDEINFRNDDGAKFDHIATELSRICTQLDIPIICTAEFRKLNGNRRPTIDDVRETVKISYEAKAILLCYNEVGIRGENSNVYWHRGGQEFKQPVLEVKVGKNKFSSYKNRMFFEFMPEMSFLKESSEETSSKYNQMIIS